MPEAIQSALVRAIRTFVQVFLTAVGANAVEIVDLSTLQSVVGAAVAAALAIVWRGFFDELPMPSLKDPAPRITERRG